MDKLAKAILSSAMTGTLFLLTSLMAVYPPPPALIYGTVLGSLVIFITHCRPALEGDDPPPVKAECKDDTPKFPPLGVVL